LIFFEGNTNAQESSIAERDAKEERRKGGYEKEGVKHGKQNPRKRKGVSSRGDINYLRCDRTEGGVHENTQHLGRNRAGKATSLKIKRYRKTM